MLLSELKGHFESRITVKLAEIIYTDILSKIAAASYCKLVQG